jgi:hypothetical protein
MHATPDVPVSLSVFWRLLSEAITTACRDLVVLCRVSQELADHEREAGRLSPHLQYDVGIIDYIPPRPQPLDETLKQCQQSLEAIWLRYY